LVFIIPFLSLFLVSCQNPTDKKINAAWKEIKQFWKLKEEGKASEEDDPQIKYAPEFFAYYLTDPNSKTGRRALQNAIMMWGNLGDSEHVEKAISRIDVHSDIWSHIISGISNAYWKDNRYADFIAILHELEHKLTNPKSKTAFFSTLGEHYLREENDHDRARSYFNKIIHLDADSYEVQRAKGNLYEMDSLTVGDLAPDFTATSINGEKIRLSELKGKVVLLDFWATWCGPCIPEIPHLKNIYEQHKDNNFVLIGVSFDRKIKDLEAFIEKENLAWSQICDKKQFEGTIAKLFNINGIPFTYIIDRNGKIAFKNLRKHELESAITQLLGSN
jgi:peroxiredoxin